jgi:5-deoxy-glucuronate isomerase
VVGENVPQAQRLVVGETFNPPGNWSSYPPHKHEVDAYPEEVRMEEIYYYRLNPPQGFGLQRIYTDDRSLDLACAVEDGDTVLLPRGYHPVVAAPGYQLYYLWMLAGHTDRRMKPRDDAEHTWVKAAGEMAKDMGF